MGNTLAAWHQDGKYITGNTKWIWYAIFSNQ